MFHRPCCSNIAELLTNLGTACLSSIAPLKTQHDGGSNRKQQPRPDGHLDLCGAHHMLVSHCRTLGNEKPCIMVHGAPYGRYWRRYPSQHT